MQHDIKLTATQFETLLKLIYAGEWIINSHRENALKEFQELTEHLFSLTKKFGIENISDEDTPQYPTNAFEQGEIRDFIDEYDDYTFWEELIQRLTEKILASQYTLDQLKEMSKETKFKVFFEIEDKVKIHLHSKGLDPIVLD